MTDAEILAAVEAGLVAQGNGADGDRAARASGAGSGLPRPFQRAARLCRAARHGRRQDRRRLCRQLSARPAVGIRHPQSVRSAHRHAARHPRRHRHHRHAHRRGDGDRRQASGAGRARSILGHIGARGTAYWNVRLLDHLFDFDEIRVHSRRPESRDAFAAKLSADLGKPVKATEDWRSCVEGADIVVEASRLPEPQPLLKTEWIKPGALVVPYGTMSAVELSLTDIMSKIVVDDWGQCKSGKFGALRAHVETGRLSEATLHAELGQIAAGHAAGPRERRRDDPVLASRPVAQRHRARQGDAGQGAEPTASARGCASRERGRSHRRGHRRRGRRRRRPRRRARSRSRRPSWSGCARRAACSTVPPPPARRSTD